MNHERMNQWILNLDQSDDESGSTAFEGLDQ